MEHANYSKKVLETEAEIMNRLLYMGKSNFARKAGWHESKVSRLNVKDIAIVFAILNKAFDNSFIEEVARQAVSKVLEKENAQIVGAIEAH
ncbi:MULTISPECIES: CII family transcriptional regulator [Providencia]|uniref:CII family transcriptional regulator n=1 Tax=Providencia TaxID=586 RepID=UPI002349F372|nr:CII family transcriptional regulator [Providencia sp. PROV266]